MALIKCCFLRCNVRINAQRLEEKVHSRGAAFLGSSRSDPRSGHNPEFMQIIPPTVNNHASAEPAPESERENKRFCAGRLACVWCCAAKIQPRPQRQGRPPHQHPPLATKNSPARMCWNVSVCCKKNAPVHDVLIKKRILISSMASVCRNYSCKTFRHVSNSIGD